VASEEEVQIVVKAVGDASGLQPVTNALKEIQQQQQQTQQAVQAAPATTSQRIIDARAAAAASRQRIEEAGGFEAFARQQEAEARAAHEATLRRAGGGGVGQEGGPPPSGPAGGPPDVPPAAVARLREAAGAVKDVGTQAGVSATTMLRFAGALTGVGLGLNVVVGVGRQVHQAIADLISDSIALEQAQRNSTIVLGQQAAAYQDWARTVSEQAGVTQRALLEAGTVAQQFGRNVGFGPIQTQGLDALAVALAKIHGLDVGQSMRVLTSALGGSAEAANTLNLQLDAGYIAFTQLGGATAEVFEQLDPSTQAMLRYEAALGQIGKQADVTAPQIDALRKAQGDLDVEWERFSQTVGPGVVGKLAEILGGMNAVVNFVSSHPQLSAEAVAGALVAPMVALNPGLLIPVIAALVGQTDQAKTAAGAAGEAFDALGKKVRDLGQAIKDVTGVDPLKDITDEAGKVASAVGDAASQVGTNLSGALSQVKDGAQQAATGMGAVADAGDRAAASAKAIADHNQRVLDVTNQIAPAQGALAAAQADEIAATRALVDMKNEQLSLTADEARIKLQMLPTQERLVELQNEATQAQIRAQQAALPSSRAQQDLQDQIRLNTLIAQSPDRSLAERQAALGRATALTRRTPETEIAALQAQIATRGPSRTAEDIQNQARLLALQQQAALQPDEYRKQQLELLSQVATAAKAAAEREIQFDIQAINVIVQGAGLGTLTDTDRQHIIDLAGKAVLDAIEGAIKTVDKRGASPQLIAGQAG